MKQIVIMPGGFHPFHAGHYALYKSALEAFPQADVYVAATNDQSERPFPFSIKEKLAKLAGVQQGRFVQVKSPFQAKEITQNYDPNSDVLIFVRSEKDKTEQPKPGGTKKDGSPAYFQPWTGKDLQPFSKHAYIAYLPTVTFGPGIQSATEIRNAWPKLDDRRKTAMVMSLYPATQKNPKLAQNVVQLLDMGMGGQLNEFAPGGDFKPPAPPKKKSNDPWGDDKRSQIGQSVKQLLTAGNKVDWKVPGQMGHVISVTDDGVIMKRWGMPRSKMRFFLSLTDDRDDRYQILMVKPGYYKVVSAEQGVAEGSDDLNYIGNCTDDDVIEHIFGDATGFAQAVEEYGDEFVLDDLVVKYDPETDVHSFYYKKQGVEEAKKKRKKKSSRSTRGYFFPGYAYYGDSGESGDGGGGGESMRESNLAESQDYLDEK